MPEYRALLSIPLHADTEKDAWDEAAAAADSLTWPGGCIRGHLELLADENHILYEDPGLRDLHHLPGSTTGIRRTHPADRQAPAVRAAR